MPIKTAEIALSNVERKSIFLTITCDPKSAHHKISVRPRGKNTFLASQGR